MYQEIAQDSPILNLYYISYRLIRHYRFVQVCDWRPAKHDDQTMQNPCATCGLLCIVKQLTTVNVSHVFSLYIGLCDYVGFQTDRNRKPNHTRLSIRISNCSDRLTEYLAAQIIGFACLPLNCSAARRTVEHA